MTSAKNEGRPACGARATIQRSADGPPLSANDDLTQGPRDAAAVFIGNGLRSLRRVVALRLRGASSAKALHEAKRAREAIDSAVWALEFESGLRHQGEL